jgi:hypothetical protein
MAALAPLWRGDVDQGLAAVKRCAENGDVPCALLLGSLYRHQSNLPVPPDPVQAQSFYRIPSAAGSGEGSERIAEMIEAKELSTPMEGGADFWRTLAAKQGWKEQRLAIYCLGWTHGPEPLHCDSGASAGNKASILEDRCPTDDEMTLLRSQGLTGRIRFKAAFNRSETGPRARAILLLDHAVPSEEDLLEPDATSVIYIQTPQDHWRMIPSSTSLLNRFLILTPATGGMGQTNLAAQTVDGSQSGGTCGAFAP